MSTWAARAKLHLSQKAQEGTDETDKTPISSVLSVHTGRFLEKLDSANDPAQVPAMVKDGMVTPAVTGETQVRIELVRSKVRTEQQRKSAATVSGLVGAVIDDSDRWCRPHSDAMTGREIDTFTARLARFKAKGVTHADAEHLADKLVTRDRESDDRRLCLECTHLSRAGAMRCAQWQRAGLGAAGIPAGMAIQLQRCDGFTDQFNTVTQ